MVQLIAGPLKAQEIIEKRAYIETRYTSGSTLTDSTGAAFNDIGKLWVPSEGEVYGTALGTKDSDAKRGVPDIRGIVAQPH